jgi:uncharacterized membrane protein YiaA
MLRVFRQFYCKYAFAISLFGAWQLISNASDEAPKAELTEL